MNAITLFWIIIFTGGGIAIGGSVVANWFGYVAGGIIGYFTLFTFSIVNARIAKKSPRCKCGIKDWSHFKVIENDTWQFVHVSECGIHFVMRKGRFWYRIDDHDKPILNQTKSYCGDWHDPTEKEIANKKIHRTAGAADD